MRISIITACYNSASTIETTLESVKSQDYPDIEHIIVDGGSQDNTTDIVRKYPHVARLISEKDDGLYDAINKGIRAATGDVVGILNADDFFPNGKVVSLVAQTFREKAVDSTYGNIAFVRPGNLGRIVRMYSARQWNPRKFKYGYMPPHPSFYAKRSKFRDLGYYQTDYVIASDYELLMRFLYRFRVSTTYIDATLVYMRTGGVSNKTALSRWVLNKEIVRACKENGVNTNMFILSTKYFNKVFEYIRPLFARGKAKA
ncbi:MAG TPA: glycosyltransferase family 2 protein [Chitinophagaceae bacterium]